MRTRMPGASCLSGARIAGRTVADNRSVAVTATSPDTSSEWLAAAIEISVAASPMART